MELESLFSLHFVTERIVSDGYAASMRNAIANLGRMLGSKPTVEDLTDQNLRRLASWVVSKKLSRATANRLLRSLIALANFARRSGFTTYRPDVSKVPEHRISPSCWTPEEFSRIVAQVRKMAPYWSAVMEAVLLVAYDTGLRIVDVIGIQLVDCDLNNRTVRVTEKKTGKRRQFVLHEQTLKAIARVREFQDTESLIPYPYHETNPLRKRLRSALEAAKLPHGRKDLFQKIRRGTVTLGAKAGLDPTKIAGHSAKWVTDTYYLDPTQETMDIANRLPRPK